MHFSTLILPVLLSPPAVLAARVPHGARRALHANSPLGLRRDDSAPVAREVTKSNKGKRLVKKKRGTCQVPVGANSTATTAIGHNNLASATSGPSSTTKAAAASSSAASSSDSDWKLVDRWQGNNFFDNFNFWSWNDPTHGDVDYLDAGQAWDSGLISVNSKGNAIMKVEGTDRVQSNRKSIRIHGNLVYTGGMVLMDAIHMPYGCGTWPAWWSNGPNWPYGGEIDILEGVNDFTQNQVSLHTGSGCKMPNNMENDMTAVLTTGGFDSHNCASHETSNQGCGARDIHDNYSYGKGFNAVNGGVYALVWAKEGIKAWFFKRDAIPQDITDEQPDPTGWGKPVADFPSDNCSPYTYFYDHFNIFDTTMCGDWAGADGVWNYGGYAGQDQSCAAITGYSTCSEYVKNNGRALVDAYWEVSSVKYFNSTTLV